MKPFTLEPKMLTMRGVFYPTGYMFIMYANEEGARNALQKLEADGVPTDDVMLLSPDTVLSKIVHTVGNSDEPLTSAGTEGATVRKYAELASQGHWALMVHAPDAKDSDHVMDVIRSVPFSYGQKYRQLVIQDLD